MDKILPISEVKARLPELVTGVLEHEEEVVVARNAKPAAVLGNYAEHERVRETIDILSDADLMHRSERVKRSMRQRKKDNPVKTHLANPQIFH